MYGKMTDKSDTKLTFIIDGLSNGVKNHEEIREMFYFENNQFCFEFIEQINIIINKYI